MIGKDLIGKYVIARTKSAGCHAGILIERDAEEAVLQDSRRIWYWDGAASLSELASRGTSKPRECKFPAPVGRILLSGVIELIECSEGGEQSIRSVPVWTA